ncbi:Arylsulfatase [Flagellimonas maritima]|uniref:Arylsulfatase n=2 Tax=Flagellimonas maritima TaxID=1383885 RepID=A0A2Z4LP69_9FLAO|nr:Arylsulfatase [Allomuricauda aurantiaca]
MINRQFLYSICFFFLVSSYSCSSQRKGQIKPLNAEIDSAPNIVWIVAEDMSANIAAFGDSTISTPILDQLAKEGVKYNNVYTPSPVCSPARSALITGMYPTALGTHNMRTGPWWDGVPSPARLERYERFTPKGVIAYEAVPPPKVKMFTEILRKSGYYTSNNSKEDYQFLKTATAWDACDDDADWRGRKSDQPFFSVFNLFATHESQIWERAEDNLLVDKDLEVPVPAYLPDTKISRRDIRRMYSNIVEMDKQVGDILDKLEADGLLDNTIIMWYTDHGGPFPRQKRSLHDSGIKVPMIIRHPDKQLVGTEDNRMISFVDFAPTILSLVGIKPPEYMQGKAFLGDFKREQEPKYIYAATDRFDKFYDQARAVRDKRFKYIKYYRPEIPIFFPIGYRENMAMMKELHRLREKDSLTEIQKIWFKPTKPSEVLYDTEKDPHEVVNLAGNPEYREMLLELREENAVFVKSIDDLGFINEKELIEKFWPNGIQPQTEQPIIDIDNNNIVSISCETNGATIGYRLNASPTVGSTDSWKIYSGEFQIKNGDVIEVVAHRIGFQPSTVKTVQHSRSKN